MKFHDAKENVGLHTDVYYDEWKSFGDGFADFWDVVCDIGSGLFGAVKDLFVGVIDLLKGVVEIAGWLLLKVVQADKIGLMPEALEEDVTGIFTGIGSILKDPGNALEAMGQSTFDNADEKGIAYSVSYVAADTAIGLLLDKGLKKLGKADDLVKPAGYSDEAADAAKYGGEASDAAMEAAERGDELAKGVEEAAGYADEGGTVPDFYVGPNGKVLPSQYKDWIGTNIQKELLDQAENPQLQNAIKQLYRGNSFIGDGGTADVIRFEQQTGLMLGKNGGSHVQKGIDMVKYIENKILTQNLSPSDRALATQLLEDLYSALGR